MTPTAPKDPAQRNLRSQFVGAFFILIVGVVTFQNLAKFKELNRWVNHTREVQRELAELHSEIQDVALVRRGYVITKKESFLKPFSFAKSNMGTHLRQLDTLTSDNPHQRELLDQIKPIAYKHVDYTENVIRIRNQKGLKAAVDEIETGTGHKMISAMNEIILKMESEEERLLAQRMESAETQFWRTTLFVVLGGVLSFGFVVASALALNRYQKKVKALNEELEHQNIELQSANRELEAFCYSVSHDLRAPLRGISGFSTALIEDNAKVLDPQSLNYLNRIRLAIGKMGELIDGLLELSRLTRKQLDMNSINLSEMANSVAKELQQHANNRKVNFVISDGLRAKGDFQLMQSVMTNLLSNAFKFTSKKPQALIEFGAKKEKEKIAFYVRDNGAGFDMKYAHKLFGTFQRLHSVQEFEGNGVGLTTAQRIIHRHGGHMWAEGSLDKGATFYFTLANGDLTS